MAGEANLAGVHHTSLTVTNLERSVAWYENVLGMQVIIDMPGDSPRKVLLHPSGFVIGLVQHQSTSPIDSFDPFRVGLDHIGLAVGSQDDLIAWQARLDEHGVEHGPLEDVPYAWAITAQDPDGTQIEFFVSKG